MTKTDTQRIELATFWPYQVTVLADQIARYTRKIAKEEAGLNHSQWRVLAAIAETPGRTAREVTDITPMDKTIVSRAVSTLIDTGFVKKSPVKNDMRQLLLTATPAGLKAYKRIAAHLNTTLMTDLAPDMAPQDFVEILNAFKTHMGTLSESTEKNQ